MQLVYLEPNNLKAIPFTTSNVIAECAGIRHDKIKAALIKNKKVIEQFGLLTSYEGESTGGRPGIFYRLNEQQATFLITLLKNTPVVVEFKAALVREFYAMKEELMRRRNWRAEMKPIRKSMTDAIEIDDLKIKGGTENAYEAQKAEGCHIARTCSTI